MAQHPLKTSSGSGVPAADLEWLLRALSLFLEHAKNYCTGRKPRAGRAKPLIALPLLGSGAAGGRSASGQLIREMLPILYGFSAANNIDIALCTVERTQWAVMQLERARFDKQTQGWVWSSLPVNLRQEAARLAEYARNDQLVLFLGAGCSVGAGLPSWGKLLETLALRAQMPADEVQALKSLNFLDQARLIALRLGGTDSLARAIATECNSPVFSLVHALLASLPVKECVTTNYDPCFELASALPPLSFQPAPKMSVLPWDRTTNCDRWLLKIHGCVNHPEDIVLTRSDYIRYETRRAALAGVVQALLITKHMLFVGFSLNDDNFHRCVDSVKRALDESSEKEIFGTALFLVKERFMSELWESDLRLLSMCDPPGAPAAKDWADSARLLEIFLDHVASLTVQPGHFFRDTKFAFCLEDVDIEFRDSLENYLEEVTAKFGSSPFVAMFKASIENAFGKRN